MTDRELLPTVELEIDPSATAATSVIWLHGLGADGHDFEPIVPMLGLPKSLRTRFVFPHAPVRPVTLNNGFAMRAWYDIELLDDRRHYKDDDILESTQQVDDLIKREVERGVPTDKIVVAGFSQGGAIALHAALRHPQALAGILALSTYLVRDDELDQEAAEINAKLPVYQAHGTYDPMVPFAWGEAARDRLTALGHPVEFEAFPMEHQVVAEELTSIGAFLKRVLE